MFPTEGKQRRSESERRRRWEGGLGGVVGGEAVVGM